MPGLPQDKHVTSNAPCATRSALAGIACRRETKLAQHPDRSDMIRRKYHSYFRGRQQQKDLPYQASKRLD